MDDIMKIVKSLKDAGLLMKRVSEIIKNEAKKKERWIQKTKGGFLSMLLGTLGASVLGILLTDKGVKQPKTLDL